jgi:uncharacterized protein (DUF58 family)
MRFPWEHIRRGFAGRIRYRITAGGWLFLLAMLMVGLGAVFSANNLLFLILAAMMATVLISGLVSRLCLAALELDFRVPEHVSACRAVPGRLLVRNQKWLIPSFSIRVEGIRNTGGPALETTVYFPLVKGNSTVEATMAVRFPKRGAYRQNSFAFFTAFPFGFLEKSARVTLRRETIVYPSIEPQPGFEDLLLGIAGEIETHYRGLGKDFYRIRPYEAFESARHVDWKATAHVGSLQIREFAREQEQTVELYLDRDIPPEMDAWFESAVDCCAYLAWELAIRGTAILFRSQGFDFRLPQEGDIYTILKYLALVYPQRGNHPEGPREDSTYKIVVTPCPGRFHEAGWVAARMLGPDALPVRGTDPLVRAGPGPDLRHS